MIGQTTAHYRVTEKLRQLRPVANFASQPFMKWTALRGSSIDIEYLRDEEKKWTMVSNAEIAIVWNYFL